MFYFVISLRTHVLNEKPYAHQKLAADCILCPVFRM